MRPTSNQRLRTPRLKQRSHSIQPEYTTGLGAAAVVDTAGLVAGGFRGKDLLEVAVAAGAPIMAATESLDDDSNGIQIQIIEATPNVSPTGSLKSIGSDMATSPSPVGSVTSSSGEGAAAKITLSPQSSLKKATSAANKAAEVRRVSFSEDSAAEEAASAASGDSPGRAQQQLLQQQQHHYGAGQIPFMNYLQVPGQASNSSFVVTPQAAVAAKTSPQARKRRQTRLMKVGSFCSITSDGDGDIFGPNGELLMPSGATAGGNDAAAGSRSGGGVSSKRSKYRQVSSSGESGDLEAGSSSGCTTGEADALSTNPKSFDPLSNYSEFQQDDCRSDISELFSRTSPPDDGEEEAAAFDEAAAGYGDGHVGHVQHVRSSKMANRPSSHPQELEAQGTFSDQGSIKSLSIDQEEITFEQNVRKLNTVALYVRVYASNFSHTFQSITTTAFHPVATPLVQHGLGPGGRPGIQSKGTAAPTSASLEAVGAASGSASPRRVNNPEYDEIMRRQGGGGGGAGDDVCSLSSCSVSLGSGPEDGAGAAREEDNHQERHECNH